jgi:transcription antitermination factor NusG
MTQPKREFCAAANLELADFDCYLPITQVTQCSVKRLIPLFSGYLFVKLCDKYPKLRGIDGISGLITQDNEPIVIRSPVIAELRSRETAGIIPTEHAPNATPRGFAPGDAVRLIDGAQAGLFGTVERLLGRHRARVQVALFGRTAPVNVSIGGLASAAN